jgi:TrmH family RNA methyltransferase
MYNPKTVRSTVGSMFHLPVIEGVEFELAVLWAHSRGMQVWAADAGGQPLNTLGATLNQPTAWVLGNEAWGFSSDNLSLCDAVISVPMWGRAESLNVSTAASICLYESAAAQHAD